MQASATLDSAAPRGGAAVNPRRIGAGGALARGLLNIAQFVYVLAYMRVITEAGDYDPVVLKAHIPFLYVDAVILVGMGLGWIVAVWALSDLMRERAPMTMRVSLVTAIIGGAALFLVAAQGIARFDGLKAIEDFSPEQQRFALHLLDVQMIVSGHVMGITAAISTFLWGYAAWRTGMLTRSLAIAGMAAGAVALLFEFTPLNLLGFLFQTPLFVWLGISLWRSSNPAGRPVAHLEVAR